MAHCTELADMQDADLVDNDVAGYRLLAVSDGHAGNEAVLAARSRLPEMLNNDLKALYCIVSYHTVL